MAHGSDMWRRDGLNSLSYESRGDIERAGDTVRLRVTRTRPPLNDTAIRSFKH